MSKHSVRDDFDMPTKIELVREMMEAQTGVRPTRGDVLCNAMVEMMQKRGVIYQPKTSDKPDDPDPYWD